MKIKFLLLFLFSVTSSFSQLPQPKNVIIMIGDGMGFNHVKATGYYLGRDLVFEDFPIKGAVATYPAKAGEFKVSDPGSNYLVGGYDPSRAWNDTAYIKKDPTESASAATAIATGLKTYNNSVGMGLDKDTLINLTELAKGKGRSTGVVTSVPFSHATPAAFVTHDMARGKYAEIVLNMLFKSRCDVIMGCGNPAFDNDGKKLIKWKNDYNVDSITWVSILKGNMKTKDSNGDGKPDPWTIIQRKEDFLKLSKGKTPVRVLGVAEVSSTLQEGRKGDMITTVPSLAQMTAGALNVVDNNPRGFFLMIEGGAIDWASHDNLKGRMIEEVAGFEEAVSEVIRWVENNSSWEETLLIVTADHETGLLWGKFPFIPLVDNGKDKLPEMTFYSGEHTNSLVPFYAKGTGAEFLKVFADEYDPVRGRFLQNTEFAQLIKLLWNNN